MGASISRIFHILPALAATSDEVANNILTILVPSMRHPPVETALVMRSPQRLIFARLDTGIISCKLNSLIFATAKV
jgi:hypothetical protein